jgi:uncharacterized membrane protein (UPF0127 family)
MVASSKPSFLQPLLREPGLAHRIDNSRNGHTVATTLLTAFDSATRRTGLLRHDSLPEGSALIIAPSNAVHTIGMRFSIDIAFVRRDGSIVKMYKALRPWRMAAAFRAFAVVELAAGALDAAGTIAGDTLVVVPAE